MKKLVERNKLKKVSEELFFIKLQASGEIARRIETLETYFNEEVLEKNKEDINQTKRDIYSLMKQAETPEKRKLFYDIYQDLKKNIGG